ncbi:RNA-binding domain-containing protein [Lachnospira multipara]|jgi:ATP-dependent DNA helicase RecG|uniref:RNA-binding domain-containing protein n=1 Tax=Lachnospira multipara TaxID=28051 RepID=UPI0004801C1D|nr:RNA-binding domain-containing protein [Lachnospira multipara]
MKIEELFPNFGLESKNIEYKGIIKEGKSDKGKKLEIGWLKTIVAFANTDGGKLIIGVEDNNHTIVALDKKEADKTILMIHRQVKEKIEPNISYEINAIEVNTSNETRYIIEVTVNKSKNLPVTLHEEGLLGIYVRNYGRTDIATPEQIKDLILLSDNIPFDTAKTGIVYDENEFKKLHLVAQERKTKISEKELISKNCITEDRYVTKGMELFADDYSGLRTKVVATVWPGLTKGGSIVTATEEYTGNLLSVLERTIDFIRVHSANGFRKISTQTVPYVSYPVRAVTEGVVNAIGHRNYYMSGTQVEINIFPDRLEITSPGALLGVRELYKEKNIASIIPRRRNEVICNLLEMCKYMEKKGSGFDFIEEDYSKASDEFAPFITTDSSSFTLTLPDLTYERGVVDSDADSPEVYVLEVLEGKNDLQILSYCYNNKRTVKEIASEIGLTASTYFRSKVIARLVKKGMLIELGDGNNKQYMANKEKVKLKI